MGSAARTVLLQFPHRVQRIFQAVGEKGAQLRVEDRQRTVYRCLYVQPPPMRSAFAEKEERSRLRHSGTPRSALPAFQDENRAFHAGGEKTPSHCGIVNWQARKTN